MQHNRASVVPSATGQQTWALWAGFGALFIANVWYATSAFSATTSAHVRVQPQVMSPVATLGAHQRRHINFHGPQATVAPPTMATTTASPTLLQAAGTAAIIGPWLSIAAIIVSVAAAVINLWKQFFEPAPQVIVAPVPSENLYRPPAQAERSGPTKMDEVAKEVKAELASRKNLTPKQVVLELQRGNARFWSGTPERPETQVMERRALIIGQAPTVCVLSCADSRVPVEILFDQGLGSVFVVRVAGNILDATAMGSIEFSVKYLGVKVLLVMGHEACGAVKGAISMTDAELNAQPEFLQTVLRNIKSNLDVSKLSKIQDNRAQDREAVVLNVSNQVKKLQKNPLLAERVADGSLLVCGAFYEITSGIVDFFTLDKNGIVSDV